MNFQYTIECGCTGEENMRRDEAMAFSCATDGIVRLRLYSWQPYTLSLGYHQDESLVDRAMLEHLGYGLVRRPTGGRAVLHAEEITYCIVMPVNGAGIHETYRQINEAIKEGLELLGAHDVEFARTAPDFRKHYQLDDDSDNCFSASALNELTWHGRKFCGSAQRRYDTVLLQHGSLLLDEEHLNIIDLFTTTSPDRRPAMREALRRRTTTLREILGGTLPSFDEIAEALASGFRITLGHNVHA